MARAFSDYFRSTIGRKTLMGLSGLGLCGFILMHMVGNLLIFAGPEKFNLYSYTLVSNPLILVAEIGLIVFFVLHAVIATVVTIRNKRSNTGSYAVKAEGAREATLASKSMAYSGLLILVFLVLHLNTFKFGPHYDTTLQLPGSNGIESRDLYKLVIEVFSQPMYVAWYVFAMVLLFLHLSHAVSASFQSLGIAASNSKNLRRFSIAFGAFVSLGFIAQALSVVLLGVQ